MRRMRIGVSVGLAILFLASVASAQEYEQQSRWHAFWHRLKVDWHRNNAWPEPFQYTDRQIVRHVWQPYITKGWQIENTLSDLYFEPETNVLTDAGKEKLHWILSSAPVERRTVFVLRGRNEEETESRVDYVQQAIAQIVPRGQLPPVVRTHVRPGDANGHHLNTIWNQAEASIQAPILPAGTGGGGGGGGN